MSRVTTVSGFVLQMVRARYDHLYLFNKCQCIFKLVYDLSLALASKQVVVIILYFYLLLWLCCHQSSKNERL